MNIIITGPPGVGKGTQSKILADKFKLLHISTGDALREEMELKTPLGISITDLMNKGQYASDSITNEIVKKKISQANKYDGYILDGYPRTAEQTNYLNIITKIDYVLLLEASESTLTRRIMNRALTTNRGDSSAAVISDRIKLYYKTVPIALKPYVAADMIYSVQAENSIEAVQKAILNILKER